MQNNNIASHACLMPRIGRIFVQSGPSAAPRHFPTSAAASVSSDKRS